MRVSSGLGAHFLSRSQHSGASDKPIALCEVLPLPLSFNHFQYGSSQLLLLGKFEYGGGPIFKVVLEC